MAPVAGALAIERARADPGLAAFARALARACVLAALIAAPLFVDPASARLYEPLKVALVRALALIAGGALLSWWAAASRAERAELRQELRDPILGALALLALAWTLSTALALAPRTSLSGSYERLQGLASLLSYALLALAAALAFRARAEVEGALSALILASVPVALIGIAQRYGLDPLDLGQDPRRVASTLGAPNFAGACAALALPPTLARLVGALGGAGAWGSARASFHGFAAALQALVLLLSQARGPLLGALGGALVVGLCLAPRLAAPWRRRALWSAAGALGICALALFVARAAPAALRELPVVGRMAQLLDARHGSVAVRLALWSSARELLSRDEPIGIPGNELAPPDARHALRAWIGYGPDGLRAPFAAVASPDLARLEARGSFADRAHNESIDALLMLGVLGALASAILWLALFVRGLALAGALPDRAARWRLAILLGGSGGAGAAAALALHPQLAPVGLGLGLFAGALAQLAWHARNAPGESGREGGSEPASLEVGLLGLLAALWVQSQFLFPTSPTYVAGFVAAGCLVALRRAREGSASEHDARPRAHFAARGSLGALAIALLGFAALRSTTPAARPAVLWLVLALCAAASWILARTDEGARPTRRAWRAHGLALLAGLLALALPLLGGRSAGEHDPLRAAELAELQLLFFLGLALALLVATAFALAPRAPRPRLRSALLAVPLWIPLALLLQPASISLARAGVRAAAGNAAAERSEWRTAILLHERAAALERSQARHRSALARDLQALALERSSSEQERAHAFERGEEELRAACELAPYESDSWANLGRFEFTRASAGAGGSFARARSRFEAALALAPRDVELARLAARCELAEGLPRAAVGRIERALHIDPRFAAGWVLAGDARLAAGELEAALEAHRTALALAERGDQGLEAFVSEGLEGRMRAYAAAGGARSLAALLRALAAEHEQAGRRHHAALCLELARGAQELSESAPRPPTSTEAPPRPEIEAPR